MNGKWKAPKVITMNTPANRIYQFLSLSRWFLIVFYAGLAVALVAYAFSFVLKVWSFILHISNYDQVDSVLGILGLIDSALVAGLIIMVIQSGFGNFVGIPQIDGRAQGLSDINFGSLKTKLAATIAAIAAIDVLEAVLDIKNYANDKLIMLAVLMVVIMLTVLVFALVEKLENHPPK